LLRPELYTVEKLKFVFRHTTKTVRLRLVDLANSNRNTTGPARFAVKL